MRSIQIKPTYPMSREGDKRPLWCRAFGLKAASAKCAKFDYTMQFAEDLTKANPTALIDLVRLLLRPLQAELMLSVVESEMHGAREGILSHQFFMQDALQQIKFSRAEKSRR